MIELGCIFCGALSGNVLVYSEPSQYTWNLCYRCREVLDTIIRQLVQDEIAIAQHEGE